MTQLADHTTSRSMDEIVADCADVTRRLLDLRDLRELRPEVAAQRTLVSIPAGTLTLVSGLDDYGD